MLQCRRGSITLSFRAGVIEFVLLPVCRQAGSNSVTFASTATREKLQKQS